MVEMTGRVGAQKIGTQGAMPLQRPANSTFQGAMPQNNYLRKVTLDDVARLSGVFKKHILAPHTEDVELKGKLKSLTGTVDGSIGLIRAYLQNQTTPASFALEGVYVDCVNGLNKMRGIIIEFASVKKSKKAEELNNRMAVCLAEKAEIIGDGAVYTDVLMKLGEEPISFSIGWLVENLLTKRKNDEIGELKKKGDPDWEQRNTLWEELFNDLRSYDKAEESQKRAMAVNILIRRINKGENIRLSSLPEVYHKIRKAVSDLNTEIDHLRNEILRINKETGATVEDVGPELSLNDMIPGPAASVFSAAAPPITPRPETAPTEKSLQADVSQPGKPVVGAPEISDQVEVVKIGENEVCFIKGTYKHRPEGEPSKKGRLARDLDIAVKKDKKDALARLILAANHDAGFYEDDTLNSGKLALDAEILIGSRKATLPKGSWIIFHKNGEVMRVKLSAKLALDIGGYAFTFAASSWLYFKRGGILANGNVEKNDIFAWKGTSYKVLENVRIDFNEDGSVKNKSHLFENAALLNKGNQNIPAPKPTAAAPKPEAKTPPPPPSVEAKPSAPQPVKTVESKQSNPPKPVNSTTIAVDGMKIDFITDTIKYEKGSINLIGTLAHDTEFVIGANRFTLAGETECRFFEKGKLHCGKLAKDYLFSLKGRYVSLRAGTVVFLNEKGNLINIIPTGNITLTDLNNNTFTLTFEPGEQLHFYPDNLIPQSGRLLNDVVFRSGDETHRKKAGSMIHFNPDGALKSRTDKSK